MILGVSRSMFRTGFCVLRRVGFQAPIPVCRYRRSRGYGSPGFFLEIRLSLLTKCTRTEKGPLRQRVMLALYRVICEWRFENGEALPLYSRYYRCYCWSMAQCLRHSSLCISYFWTCLCTVSHQHLFWMLFFFYSYFFFFCFFAKRLECTLKRFLWILVDQRFFFWSNCHLFYYLSFLIIIHLQNIKFLIFQIIVKIYVELNNQLFLKISRGAAFQHFGKIRHGRKLR